MQTEDRQEEVPKCRLRVANMQRKIDRSQSRYAVRELQACRPKTDRSQSRNAVKELQACRPKIDRSQSRNAVKELKQADRRQTCGSPEILL